jgi:glycolate dehydrogenase iron-sulfur subunit
MQTKLIPLYQERVDGQEAEEILRNCVHCGFCNATCPSYQVLSNELDGPRGRIYLIKEMLEGGEVSEETRLHLDRCLSCRACETTCPSGVKYHRLLDIGRSIIDEKLPRSVIANSQRRMLSKLLASPALFKNLLQLGRVLKPVLPKAIQVKIPAQQPVETLLSTPRSSSRVVLLLDGCVQDALAPNINLATKKVLSGFGIQWQSISKASCCGSASFHLDQVVSAQQQARVTIDAWWPLIEQGGVEAILINASGCGLFVKEYADLFADDKLYLEKAKQIALLAKDPSEFLVNEDWPRILTRLEGSAERVAFHPPCTLQHGQKIKGVVEDIVSKSGAKVLEFSDMHLCCGSAGTYSILQPAVSGELKQRKISNIQSVKPEVILTANIGCQSHLSTGSSVPVRHWLEFVAQMMKD